MSRYSLHTGAWQETWLSAASAVRVGNRVFTSGLMARERASLEGEAHQVFRFAVELLRDAGASLRDVVRARIFFVDPQGFEKVRQVQRIAFDHPGPVCSAIRVSRLPQNAQIVLELEAVRGASSELARFGSDPSSSSSLAARLDDQIVVGQILPGDTSVPHSQHADQVYLRARQLLAEVGGSPEDVVATRHYYAYARRDEAEGPEKDRFMAAGEPTSAGICIVEPGVPGASFALEFEAAAGSAGGARRIRTGRTYEVEHHYSRAVRVDDVVYVAGTTSIVPGEIVRHPNEVAGQVGDTLETIRWAVEQAGLPWTDLVRTRSYIVGDQAQLDEAAGVISETLSEHGAAATLVGVPVLGRPEVVVEIEATAVLSAQTQRK